MELRKYLKKERLTIGGFAALVGVSRQTLYNYMNRVHIPRIYHAKKIEKLTKGKVKIKELLKK